MKIRLRECLEAYERRTGRRLTYSELADKTGLSMATIKSLGSRSGYNATLRTIELVCNALRVDPGDLVSWK